MKKPKYHYIYKTTNTITKRYYIGMHSTCNINDGYIGSGKILKRSICKYGLQNHKREILFFVDTREQLVEIEKTIITESLLSDPLSMNIRLGGEGGGGWTHEQQQENNKKSQNSQKRLWKENKEWADHRRKTSREHFDKLRMAGKIPKPHPHIVGEFKHTEQTKQMLSLLAKTRGHYKGANNPSACAVKDGEGNIFQTMKDCAAFYSVSPGTISRWIKTGRIVKVEQV